MTQLGNYTPRLEQLVFDTVANAVDNPCAVMCHLTSPGTVARSIALCIACCFLLTSGVRAQDELLSSRQQMNPYGTGAGLAIALTNSGFGFGGYYVHAIGSKSSLIGELQIAAGKDEREVKFFGYFGNSYIPDKANYFLMMPLQFGIQHRLFAESIEDNFRPFVQVMAGPTLGWEYPYFRDCDDDGVYDPSVQCASGGSERTYDAFTAFFRGRTILGAGGMIGFGAHFGLSKRMTQGVRLGYTFNYFLDDVDLLEAGVEGGAQRFFGSPTISIVFGRLF